MIFKGFSFKQIKQFFRKLIVYLRKAVIKRSKLKSTFIINKKNFCITLLRRNKKAYFQNLNVKNLSDSKKFFGKQLSHT